MNGWTALHSARLRGFSLAIVQQPRQLYNEAEMVQYYDNVHFLFISRSNRCCNHVNHALFQRQPSK